MLAQLNFDAIQTNSGLPIWHLYAQPAFFITIVLTYIFPLAGFLLLIYLVVGGLQLMTSRGDPKAIQSAQGRITSALIGFVIIFIAYWVVSLIGTVFGIEIISEIFK